MSAASPETVDCDHAAEAPAEADAPSTSGAKRKRSAVASELRPEKLKEYEDSEARKGVVYMGRVPPFMKPIKVRHMLESFGAVGRVYLAPEDPAARRKRVKAGGNKKEMFVEGWIEFLDKKDAKFVAATLNNTAMGGNKRDFYGSDLWLLKYLHKFKWHHLTEKIAYEGRIRAQKLRAELAAAKKEAEHYIGRAELAKHIEAKEARGEARAEHGGSRKKPRRESGAVGSGEATEAIGDEAGTREKRQYKQRQPIHDPILGRPDGRS